MNRTTTDKRMYSSPDILEIKIDNEISLSLESVVPFGGPGEGSIAENNTENFYQCPFET